MILPHVDLILQCLAVAKGLPTESWETQARPAKISAGFAGRWVIEKAFGAAILERGACLPSDRGLVSLCNASGIELSQDQRAALAVVDQRVTVQEPEEGYDLGLYLLCCRLARGIAETVHQHLTLLDVFGRKHGERAQ